jgi:hypothetical protein
VEVGVSRVLPVLLGIGLTVYCLIDALQTDESAMRNLPKPFWLLLILLFPFVGPLAWIFAGRPVGGGQAGTRPAGWLGGGSAGPVRRGPRIPARPVAPDDDPEFLASLRGLDEEQKALLEKWEADLRERERRLRGDIAGPDSPDDDPPSGEGAAPTR